MASGSISGSRSFGAFTIIRMPDDTIRLDYPTGARYTYRIVRRTNNGYYLDCAKSSTWSADE